MKVPGKEGMLASFFTYNDNYPSTPWNEIDIEILGRYTDDIQFNIITSGPTNHVSNKFVDFNPSIDYHVYGFEWTPDYVAWFIDSVEVYRQTGNHVAMLTQAQKVMMNMWISSAAGWVGTWNDAFLPAFAYYDWVSYASYTPQAGSVGTGNNFTPQWRDDFNSWDQSRWDKASHTFNVNNCDFIYDNAVFQDGKLILCLTNETSTGYFDNNAPVVLWARHEGNNFRLYFSEEIEKESAETAANYSHSNFTFTNPVLQSDRRTVILGASATPSAIAPSMTVQNIRDVWSSPNSMAIQLVSEIESAPLTLPVKINVGGNAYKDYLADQVWSERFEYGRLGGQSSYFSGVTISGTSDPEVFRSELFDFCEYKIRVPNGRYMVTLQMAENYFSSSNKRVMNFVVEGNQILTNLDIYSRVGFRAIYQKAAVVDVADGIIDIHAQGVIDNPLLNGLSIIPLTNEVSESTVQNDVPQQFISMANYPNPFNNSTTITFTLSKDDYLTLKVYDTPGRIVNTKVLGQYMKGESKVSWIAKNDRGLSLPSGVYYYVIEGFHHSSAQKFLYLK